MPVLIKRRSIVSELLARADRAHYLSPPLGNQILNVHGEELGLHRFRGHMIVFSEERPDLSGENPLKTLN